MSSGRSDRPTLGAVIASLDVTQVFKTKGDLRRWSAKRTIGGAIVAEALYQIHENGISTELLILCGIGVLPLCLSFLEKN